MGVPLKAEIWLHHMASGDKAINIDWCRIVMGKTVYRDHRYCFGPRHN